MREVYQLHKCEENKSNVKPVKCETFVFGPKFKRKSLILLVILPGGRHSL